MKRMIAIGDNVVDCYLDDRIYYPGGNAVNVAVGCRRHGFSEAAYLGVFGDDQEARHIQWALAKEDVSYDRSRFVHAISGHPGVQLNGKGDRVFVGGPRNTAQHILAIRLTAEELEWLHTFDVCHTSCYSNLENELPKIRERCDVSFDFSNRREPAYLAQVCPHIRFAFFSGSDLSMPQVNALIASAASYGPEVVGVTLGSEGALFSIRGALYRQGVKEASVVDTMGAGDSFISGFLCAFYQALPPEACLDFAASCAADTCGVRGGFGYGRPFDA